jgi:16S rRNA (cytidine1402-2'-O)-methyltransferase
LRQVRLIAAEDTRQASKLLNHYDIRTSLTSYHEHSRRSKLPQLLALLQEGDIALVSDAGTPLLNDPGYELVRASLEAGHRVCPIPGASAPIAALVASGLPTDAFLYLGYLPRKSTERLKLLTEIEQLPYTLVFLETPHRLVEALKDLETALGDRQIAVGREMTKVHEEIFRGSLSTAYAHYSAQPPRGEITLVLAGCSISKELWSEDQVRAALRERKAQGLSPTQIAGQLANESGWPRREIYRLLTDMEGISHDGPG